ncbi:30S ribosomal protein S11, partial [Wolbachia endosymbiont of Atemnus politus]|nr:30S ribosomal protein S11 [Wolbachia endosymbiont of Atemnus politus]
MKKVRTVGKSVKKCVNGVVYIGATFNN